MNKLFLLIFILCSNLLLGQGIILKTIDHPKDKSQEVFYVLKNNESIKNGPYRFQDSTGSIIIQGSYWMGEKDSVWVGYNSDRTMPQYRGSYRRGAPKGEWEYYNFGKLNMKYDFSKNELISFSINDSIVSAYTLEINGSDTIKKFTDHPAMYIGGDLFLLEYVRNNIEYPVYAKRNKIQGNIYIGFTIDSTGTAINHRVLREIGGGCDQAAMLVVRSIKDNWVPAISNGKPVSSNFTVPVSFRLGK